MSELLPPAGCIRIDTAFCQFMATRHGKDHVPQPGAFDFSERYKQYCEQKGADSLVFLDELKKDRLHASLLSRTGALTPSGNDIPLPSDIWDRLKFAELMFDSRVLNDTYDGPLSMYNGSVVFLDESAFRDWLESNARDYFFDEIRDGRLTPEIADSRLADSRFRPLYTPPDPNNFDPWSKSHWSLAMTIAWIVWRKRHAVVVQMAEFAEQEWTWTNRLDLGLRKRGQMLEKSDRPSLIGLMAAEALGLDDQAQRVMLHTIKTARESLWQAMGEGQNGIYASALDEHGQPCRVPTDEWTHLQVTLSHPHGEKDCLATVGANICKYVDIFIPRKTVTDLWPELPHSRTESHTLSATEPEIDERDYLPQPARVSPPVKLKGFKSSNVPDVGFLTLSQAITLVAFGEAYQGALHEIKKMAIRGQKFFPGTLHEGIPSFGERIVAAQVFMERHKFGESVELYGALGGKGEVGEISRLDLVGFKPAYHCLGDVIGADQPGSIVRRSWAFCRVNRNGFLIWAAHVGLTKVSRRALAELRRAQFSSPAEPTRGSSLVRRADTVDLLDKAMLSTPKRASTAKRGPKPKVDRRKFETEVHRLLQEEGSPDPAIDESFRQSHVERHMMKWHSDKLGESRNRQLCASAIKSYVAQFSKKGQ